MTDPIPNKNQTGRLPSRAGCAISSVRGEGADGRAPRDFGGSETDDVFSIDTKHDDRWSGDGTWLDDNSFAGGIPNAATSNPMKTCATPRGHSNPGSIFGAD